MPLNYNVPCRIEPRSVGWWLDFQSNPQAGLLLTTIDEKLNFARDCGVELMPHEVTENWFFSHISECPQYWYNLATSFPDRSNPF